MANIDWMRVQRRLHKLGFNPGPIDGIRGRATTTAVKRFQESKGLVADGIVGPMTLSALFGAEAAVENPAVDSTPWLDEARRLIGVTETPGPGNTGQIMDMAEKLKLDYKGDDIPWCGLFVGHCMAFALPDEPLPAIILRARAWETFGQACTPQPGAVMVFWRTSLASGKGHVGFYVGEDSECFHILGGNQSDAVNVKRLDRTRFLQARWPLTAMPPDGGALLVAASGEVSENEA